jgi:ABC-2 type transport system ATP-binding protein
MASMIGTRMVSRDNEGPVVELTGVRKTYGRTETLRGIDLRIGTGEVVAILGPNGAGKTTAVSLMLGLRRATSGEVRLLGVEPTDRRTRSRRGAMLQDSGVPSVLTVRELVELFRSYYPSPLRAREAIGLAGLEAQAGTTVARLSGGQRQRLYFALAVCGDPEALFLDEPTTAMDVAARRAFLATIREFAGRGKTVVLTTHDMNEADQLAQRIVVIDKGLIVADDSPSAIKAKIPGRRISFRTQLPIDPSSLAGLPISGLTIDGTVVRLLSNQPEIVLSTLFARGIRLFDLEVAGADLEEAFLTLTGSKEVQ